MTAAAHVRVLGRVLLAAAVLAACCASAMANSRRDIVFDCPCSAEWVADETGESGILTVRAGIRSFRSTETGEVQLVYSGEREAAEASVGTLAPRASVSGQWAIPAFKSDLENVLKIQVWEESALRPDESPAWRWSREALALWPVPRKADDDAGYMSFVDILTDSDGDGVGDVNERLADTDWEDSESQPGASTIDVLAFYTTDFREAEGGPPYTHLLHALTVTRAVFEDSGTNIRLRIVGMSEVEPDESGQVRDEAHEELMERHGADLSVQFSTPGTGCGGCAVLGAHGSSHWVFGEAWVTSKMSALTVAHELGHVMGLVHSYRQGESNGAWRWSRGHYVSPRGPAPRWGTIMSYAGLEIMGGVFSDPLADCGAGPCGVDGQELDGADAVATLNALRFQVAAHRASAADTDGDGFVDTIDAAPEDPNDSFDFDSDGIADNADPDDDNDGVSDSNDAFPFDPNEWADADYDGIGDNEDTDVPEVSESPLLHPALRQAVEATLGKAPGAPITREELAGMTRLRADHAGISDLAGLELATKLQALNLAGNLIADISPLANLVGLKTLDLRNNSIADISVLSAMTELQALNLAGNLIADISPLANLVGLKTLDLRNNSIADISVLSAMTELQALNLAGNLIADISPLANLVGLKTLDLRNNSIADISVLSAMTELQALNLYGNLIDDISPLADLVGLKTLELRNNSIADISVLSAMTELQELNLAGNLIDDISPLAGLVELTLLSLVNNSIADISVLSTMTDLYTLYLSENAIADISPLAGLVGLRNLDLGNNRIADVSALAEMKDLGGLFLSGNLIDDISPLAGLVELTLLFLGNNSIADISVLSAMTELNGLELSGNAIADIRPLAGLVGLNALWLGENRIADIRPLAGLVTLRNLYLGNNRIVDVSALAEMKDLEHLSLEANAVIDISPLAGLVELRFLYLARNRISDIGPLVDGSIFDGFFYRYLTIGDNPLGEASVETHIPQLIAQGVEVRLEHQAVARPIADPTLRALFFDTVANNSVHVDAPSIESIGTAVNRLRTLRVRGAGIGDLAGLSAAKNLTRLYAASNEISDLSPLAELGLLAELDLRDNRVTDLAPLVSNADFGNGEDDYWVNLGGNPLSEESINEHVPALLERGVRLSVSPVQLTLVARGEALRFRVSGYFDALLGDDIELEAVTDDASVVGVQVTDGALVVVPDPSGRAGNATVTVTARDSEGRTETLDFAATVRGPVIVPLFPSDSGVRQGFMRVINRSGQATKVRMVATDDLGLQSSPLTLAVDAGEAIHLNANDLEAGNADKGLSGSTGLGNGDWRLEMDSAGELDVRPFVEASDGLMTATHDVAARSGTTYRVPVFHPASDLRHTSSLRLVNWSTEAVEALITGVDDLGQSPGGEVRVTVPAGAAVTVTAAELEGGRPGLRGRLGEGTGMWRLEVRSEASLTVMNLLSSVEGYLANLSGEGVEPRKDGVHVVPLLLSSADALGRQGVVRIINRSDSDGVVRIQAHDDDGWAYGPLELSLPGGHAVHIDSRDLELGNVEKGLSGSTGSGIGNWRLALSSDLDIQVLAYVRMPDGFLTTVHDAAPRTGRRYEVLTFNPADSVDQKSLLHLVNPGARPANVSIAGIDDSGKSPGEVVRVSIPPGQSMTLTAEQLELGRRRLHEWRDWRVNSQGALGDGVGRWRLVVDCEQPILVMNLLENPTTGHLTSLSSR